MFGKKKPEVLVVGAGPVGLFAALVLAKRGVQVEIVDEAWRPAAHSYALALHTHTLKLLEEVGLLDPILHQALRIQRIACYDRESKKADLWLGDLEEDYAFLAVISQDVMERILENALEKLGVKVLWNHQVSRLEQANDHVVATVNKIEKESVGYSVAHMEWMITRSKELEVPFVIGADGHHSEVRQACQIDFPEVGEAQHFAVFECRTKDDLPGEMALVMDEETTNVLWPLPEKHFRWSFQLPHETASMYTRVKDRAEIQLGEKRFPLLQEDLLHELLEARAPWFQHPVEQINWRLVVRFERRLAEAFGKGRMWLAGDAVHMTGPAGIQSMNVGLREAHDLVGILDGILRGGMEMDRLEAYNRDRRTEWAFLLGLERGFEGRKDTPSWILPYADRMVSTLPASGESLRKMGHLLGLHPVEEAHHTLG